MKAVSKMDRITKDSTVAFVHAKGHSERLPGKNLRLLGGIPLVCHAIRNALAAKEVDHVVIDSDSDEILKVGDEAGAIPLKRPDFLATNVITGDDLAYWQASSVPCAKIIVQVVPTSPFVLPMSIDVAVRIMAHHAYDGVVGVRSEALYCWGETGPEYRRNGRLPNSGELDPVVYETTGLYVFRPSIALIRRRRVPDACAHLDLSRIEAIDINTEEDFWFAEIVWKGMKVYYRGSNQSCQTKRKPYA